MCWDEIKMQLKTKHSTLSCEPSIHPSGTRQCVCVSMCMLLCRNKWETGRIGDTISIFHLTETVSAICYVYNLSFCFYFSHRIVTRLKWSIVFKIGDTKTSTLWVLNSVRDYSHVKSIRYIIWFGGVLKIILLFTKF